MYTDNPWQDAIIHTNKMLAQKDEVSEYQCTMCGNEFTDGGGILNVNADKVCNACVAGGIDKQVYRECDFNEDEINELTAIKKQL